MNKKNIIKYILDIFLGLGFVLLLDKMALGMKLHEIIGLTMGGAVLIHLVLNYKWITGITKKLFSKSLSNRVRLRYILNLLLFICITLIILSGVLISKTILTNISSQNRIWKSIHIGASNITLGLIGIHIGLHWNWIMNMSKKIFKFKLPNKLSNVISSVLVVVILAFGCYNIHSEGFLQRASMIFSSSQQPGYMGHGERIKRQKGRHNFNKESMTEEELNRFKENDSDKNLDKSNMKGRMLQGNHDMRKTSVIMLIINYISICGVFIIITYYINKIISRKKSITE